MIILIKESDRRARIHLTLKPLEAYTVQGKPCLSGSLQPTLRNAVRLFATDRGLRYVANYASNYSYFVLCAIGKFWSSKYGRCVEVREQWEPMILIRPGYSRTNRKWIFKQMRFLLVTDVPTLEAKAPLNSQIVSNVPAWNKRNYPSVTSSI